MDKKDIAPRCNPADGEDASFVSFVGDMWIRSQAYRDWAYRFGVSNFVHGWSAEQLEQLRDLYQAIVRYFRTNVALTGPLGRQPVGEVVFHPKFGWSLQAPGVTAYLGKASVVDNLTIEIGRQTYISGHATLRGDSLLRVGAFTSIAEGFYCNTSPDLHPTQYASMINFSSESRCLNDGLGMDIHYDQLDAQEVGIEIGSDVWVGRDVRIFHGACIAPGCVLAERSVLRGPTEPYGIYAGVPARLKKFRFSEEVVGFLLDTKWWDWPKERILRNKALFQTNLAEFDGDPAELVVS